VLIVQVDHVDTQTIETRITALANVVGFAVDALERAIRIAYVAEFGG